MEKFKLTVAEKRYIREYYRYRAIICTPPYVREILDTFRWEEVTNERFYSAYRDFAYDDHNFHGVFAQVREAIENYLIKLDTKNGYLFYKPPPST